MSNQELISKLELALSGISGAIDELVFIDGMERIREALGLLAVDVEDELEELLSIEESAE